MERGNMSNAKFYPSNIINDDNKLNFEYTCNMKNNDFYSMYMEEDVNKQNVEYLGSINNPLINKQYKGMLYKIEMNDDGRHRCNSSKFTADAGVLVGEKDHYRKQNQKAHGIYAGCNKSNNNNDQNDSMNYEHKEGGFDVFL